MSDKVRRSVSLEPDVDDILQDDNNASATVNALVREYGLIGRSREAALTQRIAEKEAELKNARTEKARIESRIDRLEREIEQLREDMHGLTDEEQRQIMAVVGLVQDEAQTNLTPETLTEDNEMVQIRANKASMDIDRFIREVEERL